MKRIAILFCAITAFLLSGMEFDLTGMPRRIWHVGKFKQSKFVKARGFVIRNGEYGSLAMRNCAIDSRKFGTLKVKFTGKAWKSGKLYFSDGGNFFEAASVRGRMEGGMMVFNLHVNRNWKGVIRAIRLDVLPQDANEVVLSKITLSEADNSIALYQGKAQGVISAELLLPHVGWEWRSSFTAECRANCEYLDIYGKSLSCESLNFPAGDHSGKVKAPARAAKIRINFGKNNVGNIRIFQQRSGKSTVERRKYEVKISNIPAVSDENTVVTPEIEFASPVKNARFQMFLTRGKNLIVAADQQVDGKRISLSRLTLKYLTAGSYSITAKVNGETVACGDLKLEHRNSQKKFVLPEVKIDRSGFRPRYILNGEMIDSMEYLSSDPPLNPDKISYVDRAAQAVPVLAYRLIFRFAPDGTVDYSELDSAIQSLLLRHPEKAFFVHVSVTDPLAGYRTNHPQEGIRDEKGNFYIKNYRDKEEATSSMASEHWQKSSHLMLKNFIAHLQSVPYGQRLLGVMPCSGITWEWLHWGSARGVMVDYSEHYRRSFINFLQKRYNGSIAALNSAWQSRYNDFAEIRVPAPELRRAKGQGDLRITPEFQPVIDHIDSISDLISNLVIDLCKTVKIASGNRILSGSYYGYTNYLLAGGRSHDCGHNGLQKVLESPWVDILMAPSRYAGRGLGGGGGFMHPESSLELHKKLIISECDVRTPAAASNLGKTSTLAATRAVVEREYASQIAGNAVMRYFDFSHGWVTEDQRIFDIVKKSAAFDRQISASSVIPEFHRFGAGVFTSAATAARLNRESRLNLLSVENSYQELIRAGVSFNMYTSEDIAKRASEHRLQIYLNTMMLSDEEKNIIAGETSQKGKVIFFNSHSGMLNGKDIDTGFMEKLFQTRFIPDWQSDKARTMTITAAGAKFLGIPEGRKYVLPSGIAPLFFPEKAGTVLAYTNDGKIALALKNDQGAALIWSAYPLLNADMISGMAKRAGLPTVDCTPRVPVWFNRGMVAVHTAKESVVKIDFSKYNWQLKDWENGKVYPGKMKRKLAPESTAIFTLSGSK